MKELMEQYPNVLVVFETKDAVTLTAEEHEILHTYFQLESGADLIEREYHFYMVQFMMFSYGSMLAKLKKEIMNPEEGDTGRLLDFFMETRTDELEKELRTQNQHSGEIEFPNENALLKLLYLRVTELYKKRNQRPVSNWALVRNQLDTDEKIQNRIRKYENGGF